MSKATIVIAYLNSCEYRKKNFDYISGLIRYLKIPLVVVEQSTDSDSKEIEVKKYKDYTHLYYSSKDLFHKSKLYNISLEHVNSNYIWFLDADVLLPFEAALNSILNQDLIRPFGPAFQLNEEDTENVFKNKNVDLSKYTPCNFFGKHSLIIKKNKFVEVGMFDEKFFGWGWEDLDFVHTRASSLDAFVFEEFQGFHLYHPPSSRENERCNHNIYLENKNSRKELSLCMSFQDLNLIDYSSIKFFLEKHDPLDMIDLNFLIHGEDYEEIIKKLLSEYKDYLFSKRLSIFYSPNNFSSEVEEINTSIYVSQGKSVGFLKNLNDINLSLTQEILTKMRTPGVKIFSNKDQSLFVYNRSFFDSINGFDQSLKANQINKDLIKKSVSKKFVKKFSSYGNRDGLMYLDLNFGDLKHL